MHDSNKILTVMADVMDYSKNTAFVTCPFCNGRHGHGIKGGEGHRVSDCPEGFGIGYYLTFPKIIERKHTRRAL